MADDVRIDSLSIEIESNVKPAAQSINSLASAVKKFNDEVAKGKGFGEIVNLANSAKTAADNMKDAPARLRELADALRVLGQASKGVKFSKELATTLSDIGVAAKNISANVGQRLNSLAAGLTALRDVGDVRISPTIGSGIASINEAVAGINVNNLSRIGRFVEAMRPLQQMQDVTISGNIAREIVNIATAAETIRDVDFTPFQQLGTALASLGAVGDIRIPHRLAEDIVNLGIAAQEVQGTDWTEFERMAAGLRHLEGLGQIRIPRIRPTQQREQDRQDNAARNPSERNNGLSDDAERAAVNVERLRRTMQSTNDVQAFVRGQRDVDIIALRLAAARDRLQDLINADGALNLRGIANATEEVKRLERELATAKGTLGGFMKDAAGGFVKGAGIGGIVGQLKDIFSSPGSAIGYGIGAAINGIISAVGRLGSALKSVSVKAFTLALNGLQTALHGVASAAKSAASALVSFGKLGGQALAAVAKIEFKGLMALPTMFASGLGKKISDITSKIKGFVRSLGRIAFYRAIRSAIKEITKAFSEGIKNLYQWSKQINGTFAQSMDKIATSLLYLKNSIGAAVSPILEALAPVLEQVVDKVVEVINRINQLFSALSGKTTYTAAKKISTEWAEAAKEAKKTILGFDEINQLQKDTRKDKQDYGSMFETRTIDSDIAAFAKKIREFFQNGEWAKLGKLLADQINSWIDSIDWDAIGKKIANGLNAIAKTFNSFMENIDWIKIGEGISKALNQLVDKVDWDEVGRMFSQKLNALSGILLGFAENFEWAEAGVAFAEGVWGFIDGIKWDQLGTAIGESITGLATSVYNAALNFPWTEAGKKLASGANKLFSSIEWTVVADGITELFQGALDSLKTFITTFNWTEHGKELKKGIIKLVSQFPVTDAAKVITGGIQGALRMAMPTLKDTELMKELGGKLAEFLNGIFDNSNGWWDTVGEAANDLIVDVLTIGQSFVDKFNETQAANSINAALEKIHWNEIATKTWNLISSALSKAGNFANALFWDNSRVIDTAGVGTSWVDRVLPDSNSLGTRIADSLKKVLMQVPWESIAKTTWDYVKKGFKIAYDFVSAMFGLDEKTAADTNAKIKKIGEKIGGELQKIPWASIASDVWKKIKTAFSHAGNFVDALLNYDTSTALTNFDERAMREFNKQSFGYKLGDRISKEIAKINWKQYGTDLGNAARNFFINISEFFRKLNEDGTVTNAVKEFVRSLPKDLPDKIVEAGAEMFKMIGKAIATAIWEGIKSAFTADTIKRELSGETSTGVGTWSGAGVSEELPGDQNVTTWGDIGKALGFSASAEEYSLIPAGQNYKTSVSEITAAFQTCWETIKETFKKGIGDALYAMYTTLDTAKSSTIPAKMNDIDVSFKAGWTTIQATFKSGYGDALYAMNTTFDNLSQNVMPNKMSVLNTAIENGWNTIKVTVKQAYGDMFYAMYQTFDTANNSTIPTKMSAMNTAFANGWNIIKATFKSGYGDALYGMYTALDTGANTSIPSKMQNFNNGFKTGWSDINNTTRSALGTFYSIIRSTMDSLDSYLPSKFKSIFNQIVSMANSLINRIESACNNMISGLNRVLQIHLEWTKPDWAGGGTYWWNWNANIPSVDFNNVSYLANGGILNTPTWLTANAIGGEAGREAVLPLESHTEWMDAVADRVVAASNANYWNNGMSDGGADGHYDNSREIALIERLLDEVRAIRDKDTTVEITTGQIARANVRQNKRAGATIIPVGT